VDFPAAVLSYLDAKSLGGIQSEEKLDGGLISLTRRIKTSSTSLVLKQCAAPPPNLYEREAEGLQALAVPGGPRVPEVFSVGSDHLLLEDLGKTEPGPGYWETFGRQVAQLHSNTNPKFGFHKDNYLGILLMDNSWSEDGHEFFARTRILRFLDEPLTQESLTSEDVKKVESIAKKLPDLVPYQPACLIHGDLWTNNMICTHDGQPAIIDPGTYYGWPEAELSMTAGYAGVDPAFFDAYREVHPLEPGWEDRFALLHIRELLSMIAHGGDKYGTVKGLRELLDRFA